ncbi:hypothetical protein BDN70DRAFT_844095 [Pholiota conissans]|uniref:HNH nuclease domain-containing protein n=1 Tax=Pholiota conissans TaxID=109636 RepID=A0A9P6CU69_9AGAR|nr:hypothetical protein BDN70DRAFT_844095 [Pholiota conissans]
MSPTSNLQPLPLNPFEVDTLTYSAYDECFLLEQKTEWNEFADDLGSDFFDSMMSEMTPVIVARVLGHALRLSPSPNDRGVLVREIMDCKAHPTDVHVSPELFAGLAHLYIYGMMGVFYNPKGSTPLQSSQSSFEDTPSHLLTPTLMTTQTLRQRTMLRDENRCVFTGCLDTDIYISWPKSEQLAVLAMSERSDVPIVAATNVAHIISQSLSSNIGGMTQAAREKFAWASTAATVLEYFGGFSAYTILGEDKLNSAANTFTAGADVHHMFDRLNLWLVPAQDSHANTIAHTYVVCSPDPDYLRVFNIQNRVIFRSHTFHDDDGNTIVIPPPHPSLIALHAICAQVAHISGAAEQLAELYPDSDLDPGPSVMTQPNASAKLVRKLKLLQLIPSTGRCLQSK